VITKARLWRHIDELRTELAAVRRVGAQMSNVCFNLSQSSACLVEGERRALAELAKEWDAIPRTDEVQKAGAK
jgi:hypothetical protein